MFNAKVFRFVLAAAVFIIMAFPVGVANIYLGFINGESPCILCGNERFGMVLIGALGVFILRYGARMRYVVTLLLVAFYYLYTTVRHWGGRANADLGQGFGDAVLGVHTYTWGILVYWVVIGVLAIGLIFIGKDKMLQKEFTSSELEVKKFSPATKFVAIVAIVITCANCVQFLIGNGIPPYAGAGDPARFTFNIAQTAKYWDKEHQYESLSDIRLHKFNAPDPYKGVEFDATPLAGKKALELVGTHEIGFGVTGFREKGRAAGIAYDSESQKFGLVSSKGGFYYTDKNFKEHSSFARVDVPNGSDIHNTVDAAFFKPGGLVAIAQNKTVYGAVIQDDVDEKIAWKDFTETSGNIMPIFDSKGRPESRTIRARMAYTLTVASESKADTFVTLSVPHKRSKQVVISEFSKEDNKLVREGVLDAEGVYPVGADLHDGTLYVLSKEHNSLLRIDMKDFSVKETHNLPELNDVRDIAVAGKSAFVLAHDGDRDIVHELKLS
ncbi:disulfide bond formation protein B [Corynebacterium pseudotuberculosis]|uniref:disulfide bond formation protein B n=1 Tax=Corynebacterium pseudotuberculosis TaxID=1719 RepID=UPI00071B8897|nr:disulfide bond formation protein B [Corynebacterium pseudotuberculosis]ALR34418.1 disulfide bond formation protein, DsbB family [Corynebacterium pseudotuberculosis]